MRKQKLIGSGQEATLTVRTDAAGAARLDPALLATLCIVSEVQVVADRPAPVAPGEEIVEASRSPYAKCERCWNLRASVGQDAEHPTLCDRCVRVVAGPEAGVMTRDAQTPGRRSAWPSASRAAGRPCRTCSTGSPTAGSRPRWSRSSPAGPGSGRSTGPRRRACRSPWSSGAGRVARRLSSAAVFGPIRRRGPISWSWAGSSRSWRSPPTSRGGSSTSTRRLIPAFSGQGMPRPRGPPGGDRGRRQALRLHGPLRRRHVRHRADHLPIARPGPPRRHARDPGRPRLRGRVRGLARGDRPLRRRQARRSGDGGS